MAIKRSLGLNLTKGTDKAELQRFLDAIPENVELGSSIHHIAADRPWEPERFELELTAEWTE
jgi:hypothetical protein